MINKINGMGLILALVYTVGPVSSNAANNTNPGAGEISFVSVDYSVRENEGPVTISVQRSGGSDGAVSVKANTSGDSASEGQDYTSATSTLNWADGELGIKAYDIRIKDDQIDESAETVRLTLTDAINGAVIASPGAATLTIGDPIRAKVDAGNGFLPVLITFLMAGKRPRWSVVNRVCCDEPDAPQTTFELNLGPDSRSSIAQSCSVDGPQSSEVETTAGNKNFTYSFGSEACGSFDANDSVVFQENTRYEFRYEESEEDGSLGIGIYAGPINSTDTADNSGDESAPKMKVGDSAPKMKVGDPAPKLKYVTTIRLANVIEGESSFKSITGNFQAIEK
ncbi:MAG: hypothetical protein ACI9WC_001602 [Arenicella sp.]|jgi:hypothetical protein